MSKVRLGAGAGYSGDRIQPALDLVERGSLDYIVFECLAERTIALAQQSKAIHPELGYDPMLASRMRKVLPACHRHGTKLISNMGAANPRSAAKKTAEIARELGISGMKIAAIEGDDVLALFQGGEFGNAQLLDSGAPVSSLRNSLISANVYIGAEPIVQSLAEGADMVLGGRIADPALFLGPLRYEFGWASDDWYLLGAGIAIGHLLECAGQLSGGYFADPPFKTVPDLANLGFPYASVDSDGSAEFSKLDGTGGAITLQTCKEQLLYEIHDPGRYVTPDVIANFSEVELVESGTNRVRAIGATGSEKPASLKVSIGYADGYLGEGQITYAGTGAVRRAELAIKIVKEQLKESGCALRELRAEMIGLNSVVPTRNIQGHEPPEVRVRVAGRVDTLEEADHIAATVEALYTNGPAGGGGASRSVRPIVAIESTLIPRGLVHTEVELLVS
jgi:Acyclic terpene utilisation family protein AtuA